MLAPGRSKSRKRRSSARRSAACRLVQAVRGGQIEVRRWRSLPSLSREKDGDAGDQQGLRQALDDGIEQGAQIGLGVEAAAEVDQRLAVVEALLVEDAIDACLDRALERIEERPVMMMAASRPQMPRLRKRGVDHLAVTATMPK